MCAIKNSAFKNVLYMSLSSKDLTVGYSNNPCQDLAAKAAQSRWFCQKES